MAIAAFTYNSTTSFLDRITCTRQRGQGLVEYAFILALVSLVIVVMLITTGGQIKNLFSDITYTLNNQAGL
jgi:Flp pilus assembly pilin Flp